VTARLEQWRKGRVLHDGERLGHDLIFQLLCEIGASRGDEGPGRPFLVFRHNLRQML